MNISRCILVFLALYAEHLIQVHCAPRAPKYPLIPYNHYSRKSNKRQWRGKELRRIPHFLKQTVYPENRLSNGRSSRSLDIRDIRGIFRDHIGFHGLPPVQIGRKMSPKVYMSTKRFPRTQTNPGIRHIQLGTNRVTSGQINIQRYTEEQLSTSRGTSKDKISSGRLPMAEAISPRDAGKVGTREQMTTERPETMSELQEQMARKAQEYWWKSGFIEGLNRKLEEAARKSAFPSTLLKGMLTSKDGQLDIHGDNVHIPGVARNTEEGITRNKSNISAGEIGGKMGHAEISQGTNTQELLAQGDPLSPKFGKTRKTEGQIGRHIEKAGITNAQVGTRVEQARISDGQIGTREQQTRKTYDQIDRHVEKAGITEGQKDASVEQARIIDGQKGTRVLQTRINNGKSYENMSPIETFGTQKGESRGHLEIYEDNNTGQLRTSHAEDTGQTRTTEGQVATNAGQSGTSQGTEAVQINQSDGQASSNARQSDGQSATTEAQSGTTEGQETTSAENAAISNSSPECAEPVDLAFLVDGSGSIDPYRQFPKVRKFLKQIAAAFQIGPAKTKLALVQFSGKDRQKVEFGLDQYSDLNGIIEGIDRMEQMRGNTYVGEGFKLVSREIFSPGKGDRPEVRNVLILFTDGAASDFQVAKQEAADLKANGTTIICVGAGHEYMLQFFRFQLEEFASDPPGEYVFTKGFEELDRVVKAISSMTCEEAKNPPAPPATANATIDVNLNSYKTANHYWAFDVVNGDIVTDLIGRKRCTLTGGAHLFMSVKRKMVCSMVESGGYLDFGSWTSECITDPDLCTAGLTITMWLRIQAKDVNYNSEYQYILSSGAEGESMRGVVFLLKAKDEIYKLLVRTTGQAWSITLPADRIPSVWFSFAFSWKRSLGLAVYLNGFKVEENMKPTNVEGPDVSNALFIARPATSTSVEYQTKFRIDDFAIFYRFMTDQEVQTILFEVSGPPAQGGVDLCTPNPCKNGGTCSPDTDTASGFVCQCVPGWTGGLCSQGGPEQTPTNAQSPSGPPSATQGPSQSPPNSQAPSGPPSEIQGPGQSPPSPQIPSPPPSRQPGTPPFTEGPKNHSTSIPTGATPPRPPAPPPGQQPTVRPKDCPPCPADNPNGPGQRPPGSPITPKCTPVPPGSKICTSTPPRSLADDAHTYRISLPPIFGPYNTADNYDCTPQCTSDCTSGGCSNACCGSCPPICRKFCRADCPSRCCGRDAIIPQRRHGIARPSRKSSHQKRQY